MRNEFRNNPSEFKRYKEYQVVKENPQASEFKKYKEFVSYEESTNNEGKSFKKSPKANKKEKALASMSTGVASAIAVAAVGMTTLINVAMKAEFKNVEYVDGQINYSVEVEKMTDDETLYAYLFKEGELIDTIDLSDEDQDGQIDGYVDISNDFDPKVSATHNYRLSLAGNVGLDVERKFDSYVIEIDNRISSFNSLAGECHCGEDGYYYFTMDFTDDQNIFKNFEATITDSLGNVAKCEFNDDLHSSQRIYVLNLKGSSGILEINYTANGEKQSITKDITM